MSVADQTWRLERAAISRSEPVLSRSAMAGMPIDREAYPMLAITHGFSNDYTSIQNTAMAVPRRQK